NALAYLLQMYAITLTLVPYLIAVKRMSVLFTSLYGFIILKERLEKRLIGIVLMIIGVFLMSFFV
ncbi:MAG: EamA family transporter, partial [Candidatus Omnitrophica bacterium]|nr:EamA family transporter [Candidatus Omnitrophota bacterium]